MIVICGLNDNLNLQVAKGLSDELDMFLLDLKKLLEYEIIQKNEIIEKIGIDYLEKLETSAIKRASTYENTVLVAGYDNFMFKDSYKLFQNKAIIIYLKQPKTFLQKENVSNLNILNHSIRNKQLEKISNFVISLTNNDIKLANNKIIKKLKEVLL